MLGGRAPGPGRQWGAREELVLELFIERIHVAILVHGARSTEVAARVAARKVRVQIDGLTLATETQLMLAMIYGGLESHGSSC